MQAELELQPPARGDLERELAAANGDDGQAGDRACLPTTGVFTLRIAPNQRSWSATPDAILRRLEPPEMLDLHLPVGYSDSQTFAVTVDKVNHGRKLSAWRRTRTATCGSPSTVRALGPDEYRIHLQGYTWRGERRDAGWVRLAVS